MLHDTEGLNAPRPVSIAVAPNGGRKTHADHPALPMTPEALAHTASLCLDAGASMIHVHARNRDGRHLLDADAYRAIIHAINGAVGDRFVVQITSESLGIYRPAEQMQVVRNTRPEAVSLALRELLPDDDGEVDFATFLAWLRRENVMPQFILYAPDEARRLAHLQARGVIPFDRLAVLYVLGRYAPGQVSSPADLLTFLDGELPRFSHWTTCAFGTQEAAATIAGALLGGHIRVGFENNHLLPDGRMANGNEDLVRLAQDALSRLGYRVCSADEVREAWRC